MTITFLFVTHEYLASFLLIAEYYGVQNSWLPNWERIPRASSSTRRCSSPISSTSTPPAGSYRNFISLTWEMFIQCSWAYWIINSVKFGSIFVKSLIVNCKLVAYVIMQWCALWVEGRVCLKDFFVCRRSGKHHLKLKGTTATSRVKMFNLTILILPVEIDLRDSFTRFWRAKSIFLYIFEILLKDDNIMSKQNPVLTGPT